jgi:signal transduction histidine kinase/ligand-binding sensor domain-containing protein/CheY-like chemotaxis protein
MPGLLRPRLLLAALVAVATAVPAAREAGALDPFRALTQFAHEAWQDELPQNTVHTILQTSDGYLWLGTYEGLVRFDGVRFVVFDSNHPGQLRGTTVQDMLEDEQGRLWLATNGGLTKLEKGKFENRTRADGLPSENLLCLARTGKDALWIGTDHGLARWDGKSYRIWGTAEGLPAAGIRHLAADRTGNLWIATDRGLARLDVDGTIRKWGVEEGLPHPLLRPLLVDRAGDLWIGSNGGLTRFREGKFQTWTRAEGLPSNFVRALAEDGDGNLWIGTEDGGVVRFHDGKFSSFSAADGLSNIYVRSIYEDREGSLWVGTNGGLNRFRDGKFTNYSKAEGLCHDFTRTILDARDGTIWIGTDGGGVGRFRDGRFDCLGSADGLANDFVRSLLEDRKGNIWAGTRFGLSRWDGKAFETFSTRDGLGGDLIRALAETPDGTIWVGSEGGGLSAIREGKVAETITTANGLSNDDVRSLFVDRRGALWAGTYGGLNRIENGKITVLTTKNGLANDIVFALHEDQDGSLWIGTDNGLSRFLDGKLVSFRKSEGLCENKFFQILDDDAGNLWTSSNQGICRIPKADLDAVASGRLARVFSTAFNRADGMRVNQCNGSSQPAGARDRSGRLWFPTVKGVAVIDPARIRTNPLPPPIVVEEILADGVVASGGAIHLSHSTDKLEIHYTALSLLAPSKVQFRYLLEGYDHDWQEADTRRTAYYTNLPPGRYTFRVTACNDDELWNEKPASLPFEIATPWWKRWWATSLWALTAAGLVQGGIRWRTRHLRQRNEELARRVAERTVELDRKNDELAVKLRELEASEQRAHESEARALDANRAKSAFLSNMSHELRTPLNSIIGFAAILRERLVGQIPDKQMKFLANIHGSGEHLLGLINDVLDLSKIEAGKMELFFEPISIESLLEGVRAVMKGVTEKKEIDIEFDFSTPLPTIVADPGKTKQILFNLLSNAVKFSPPKSTVTVRARRLAANESPLEAESLRIDVIDRGIGIAEGDLEVIFEEFRQADAGTNRQFEGTGLGLSLVRRLLELHKGRIDVASRPGQGSCFTVHMPVHPVEPAIELPAVLPAFQSAEFSGGTLPVERPRVLVVEDDPEAFRALANLLEAEGYSVVGARHREEAIRMVEAGKPALITLDIVLPGTDGWSVLKELKSRPETRDVPVVVVTMRENRELGFALGAQDFFVKPVRGDELLRRIRELAPPPKRGGGSPILLIDDDRRTLELVSAELEPIGYRILGASSGEEGLAIARARHPSIIVLDLMMPGMTGFEVAEALQSDPATADIPIVVLTAKELDENDRRRLEGKVAALVGKGSESARRLLPTVRGLIRRTGPASIPSPS